MTDRYARVYFDRIAKDPKFDGIREDGPTMGSWVLLLIEAEKAWPAPAFPLPSSWVPTKHFRLFAERQIIDVQTDGRFRVHGLDKERGARSERGKDAAVARWSADRNADSNATGIASRISDSNANAHAPVVSSSTSAPLSGVGGPGEGDDGRPDVEAFLTVRFRAPTKGQRDVMDSYVRVFDVTGPQRAAALILRNPDDPIGALMADLKAFREERVAEAKKAERPAPVRRRKPSTFTGVNAELQKLLTAQYAEQDVAYRHQTGQHQDAPDEACSMCRGDAA